VPNAAVTATMSVPGEAASFLRHRFGHRFGDVRIDEEEFHGLARGSLKASAARHC
jgi:hypothetical protein